jgi:hypothetical protein
MGRYFVAVIGVLAVLTSHCEEQEPEPVAAPVIYEDLMLIISGKNGVAALVFRDEITKGVNYEYRYLSNDLRTRKRGTGVLCEKFTLKATKDPKLFEKIDIGSQLFIKIESISVEWSFNLKGRGWIYYSPENVRVQLGHAKDFHTVDLRRFVW